MHCAFKYIHHPLGGIRTFRGNKIQIFKYSKKKNLIFGEMPLKIKRYIAAIQGI